MKRYHLAFEELYYHLFMFSHLIKVRLLQYSAVLSVFPVLPCSEERLADKEVTQEHVPESSSSLKS